MLACLQSVAQDTHYAQVQDMKLWFNPALKTDRKARGQVHYRNVQYPGLIDYSSKAFDIDLPMDNSDDPDEENVKFANLTIGLNLDNGGGLNSSSVMADFSYALPLNYDNTYLALGFQAAYDFSSLMAPGYNFFPKGFDRYGPVGAAMLADPDQTGYTLQYFNGGAGLALFHNGEKSQWYMGLSARHLNQPVTESFDSVPYRLAISYGAQFGLTTTINSHASIGAYAFFNWQGGIYEHLIAAVYNRIPEDSAEFMYSFGLNWKINDAIMPNVGVKFSKNRFFFYYEINPPGTEAFNYSRRAYDLTFRRDF